ISDFLKPLPADCPGIVMVQHMPEHFTKSFAQRLNESCKLEVREAKSGDAVESGVALLAPGSHHLVVKRTGVRYVVEIVEGSLVSRHRPSVDVLFRSVAGAAGKNAVGVILTGMGDDGATGMLEMKNAGAYNFAQDRDSCVVFGMPNEAIKNGGVDQTLALAKLPMAVLNRVK
ncbi:MAG: CheB methylesterase domain-containing protein, partial [Verrucomicrobiia bacterium]